ncbi:flippase [Clostridium sp. HMb25]|nr:flippase [Clostridium sp. HMb25]
MKKTETLINNSIKMNLLYNIIYQVLSACTPLITSPIVSRSLGAGQLGIYSYTYSVAYYFLLFGMLGVKNYGNRSIARVRGNREELSQTFWSIYFFQLLSSIVMLLAYGFYVVILCEGNLTIAIIQGMLVLSSIFDISWLFFGFEQFKITTIRSSTIKLLSVVLIVLFVHNESDLWKYTVIMAGGALLSQLIMWPFLRSFVDYRRPKLIEILRHFKPNIILFIPVIATNLFKYMDKIMLGKMTVMTELGYYENAERLIQIPNSFVTALGTVMLPRMSNLAKNDNNKEASLITSRSMMISIFACSAMAFGIVGVSDVFVPVFFGEDFLQVIPLLYLLAPIMIFICWGDVIRTQYLIPNMKDVRYLVSVAVASLCNLLINYLLIPSRGAIGVAIGTVCAEFLVCFLQTIMVGKSLPILNYIKDCIWFVLFGVIMYFAIRQIYVYSNLLTIIIRIGAGAIIYLTLSYIYLFKFHKDILKNIIPSTFRRHGVFSK